jgi:hypothetical protein
MKMSGSKRSPWRRKNPKRAAGESRKLSGPEKASAKRSAKKAGRSYPNLVDNMRVAQRARAKK